MPAIDLQVLRIPCLKKPVGRGMKFRKRENDSDGAWLMLLSGR